MSVTAKFRYDRKEVISYPQGRDYTALFFAPVTGNCEENKSFWDATPGGEIRINVANKQAIEYFVLGKEYYIDFTEAHEPVSA